MGCGERAAEGWREYIGDHCHGKYAVARLAMGCCGARVGMNNHDLSNPRTEHNSFDIDVPFESYVEVPRFRHV